MFLMGYWGNSYIFFIITLVSIFSFKFNGIWLLIKSNSIKIMIFTMPKNLYISLYNLIYRFV